jgi:hypothetical protein
MSRLITPSLIGSVDWFKKAPPSWKEKAYTDLTNTLSRIYTEPSPEIKQGMEVEHKLNSVLTEKNYSVKCSDNFRKLINKCKNSVQQKKSKKIIDIEGESFCLYGKIDYLFPKQIIDLKTTKEYKPEKYLNSWQHKIYCYNEGIEDFLYLIAEMEDGKIEQVYELPYKVTAFEEIEASICGKIIQTIRFLELDEHLYHLYNTKFCLY